MTLQMWKCKNICIIHLLCSDLFESSITYVGILLTDVQGVDLPLGRQSQGGGEGTGAGEHPDV